MAAKTALHASKTAQSGSKTAQDDPMAAQDGLKRAQRGPLDGSRELQEEPPEGPKRQKQWFRWFFIDCGILTFPGFRQLKKAQEVVLGCS